MPHLEAALNYADRDVVRNAADGCGIPILRMSELPSTSGLPMNATADFPLETL